MATDPATTTTGDRPGVLAYLHGEIDRLAAEVDTLRAMLTEARADAAIRQEARRRGRRREA